MDRSVELLWRVDSDQRQTQWRTQKTQQNQVQKVTLPIQCALHAAHCANDGSHIISLSRNNIYVLCICAKHLAAQWTVHNGACQAFKQTHGARVGRRRGWDVQII